MGAVTYYFSTECYILSSYEVDPTRDVPVLITNMYAFYSVLEEQIGCMHKNYFMTKCIHTHTHMLASTLLTKLVYTS